MIIGFTGCWITARDYRLCSRLLEQLEAACSELCPALRSRLERAVLVDAGRLPPSVVTLGSSVEYSLDDGPLERRILVHDQGMQTVGLHLPVATARGIALIGMRERQVVEFKENGRIRRLLVGRVTFQAAQFHMVTETTTGTAGGSLVNLASVRIARGRALPNPNSPSNQKKESR